MLRTRALRRSARSSASVADAAQEMVWIWSLHAGVMVFVAGWCWQRGLWWALVQGDPSGISAGIVLLAVAVSLWVGHRTRVIARQVAPGSDWRQAYRGDLSAGVSQAADLLSDRAHGPHETAWWFAAAAIKLGLLGTVVGFIVMSMTIGQMPSFELDQVQDMLRRMTQGMAIALYTTLVGLIANLWLGLQLLLLDRLADRVVADILGAQNA